MNPIFLSICLALHTLSTILLVGNYVISALVVVPILRRFFPEEEQSRLLPALVARSRPWVLSSIATFIVTGILMLVTDSHYLGFMEIGNFWSVLMYTKHILVLGWIALGVYLDISVTRRLAGARASDRPGLLAQFQRINGLTAAGGVIIILMTAVMQVI
jgi:uncharacterized membrane protein